jgi:SAM-dependent methyltransferase
MSILKKFGVAGKDYASAELARGDTYTTLQNTFPSTNLACKENPFIEQLQSAKYILDFGCGVGRNLSWVMNNTNANYIGLDPNTSMTDYFWDVQTMEGHPIDKWKSRTLVINDFSQIPKEVRFDYIISTFVLQHLGYRYSATDKLNLTEITKKIISYSNTKAIWFAIEHDSEENWIPRWISECNINLDVYIRSYKGLPELNDRDFTAQNGGHHLIIFQTPTI